ncbi:MAG: MoaD family protein [Dehalococcoidia bacterium]|jgi:molybdopterin synthase sulfur carrier subunit|nr:MoaD family protein [Dehalococcoidia bacterium]HJN58979.1 MoaD family protein [Dehalococcoidia bacterium]
MVNEEIVYVRIPAPLRNLTGENNKIEINLSNIDERQVKTLLDYVDKEFPGFKAKLFNPTGELKQFVNIFINGEDARYIKGINTEVVSGDEISIVPAVAGGSSRYF